MVIVCLYEGHILDYSQSSSRDVASRAVSTRACLQNTNLHCTAKPGAGAFPILPSWGLEPFLHCQTGGWSLSCTVKPGAGAFPGGFGSRSLLEPSKYRFVWNRQGNQFFCLTVPAELRNAQSVNH